MASLPIKSDQRPVSMLELTLNLNDIDFESEELASSKRNSRAILEEEEIIPQSADSRNVQSMPEEPSENESESRAPVKVILSMASQPKERHQELEAKLNESEYTESLAKDILKESVQEIDPMVFVNKINEECLAYITILYTIKVSLV